MTDKPKTPIVAKLVKNLGIIVGFVFVIAAISHRLTLGSPGYIKSPLIGVEIGLVLVLMLLIVAYFFGCVIFLLTRNWPSFRTAAVNLVICVIGLWAGVVIDAPTLIYMT